MTCILNPSIWESEIDRSQFEDSLVYIACSRTFRATRRNSVSNNQKQSKTILDLVVQSSNPSCVGGRQGKHMLKHSLDCTVNSGQLGHLSETLSRVNNKKIQPSGRLCMLSMYETGLNSWSYKQKHTKTDVFMEY